MKRLILLLMAIIMIFVTACSGSAVQSAVREVDSARTNVRDADNKYVLMVKGGHKSTNPDLTYDTAFNAFFGTPRWRYFESDDGLDVVEFTGDCMYLDVQVRALIQFVIDEEEGTFDAVYLSFNDVPQNLLLLWALIEKAFGADDELPVFDDDNDAGGGSYGGGGGGSSGGSPPSSGGGSPGSGGGATASLSVDEARAIAQAWLNSNPIDGYTNLDRDWYDYTIYGEDYYRFFLNSNQAPHMYWFNILVHKNTGEMFMLMTEDGEFPVETVYNLYEWYDRYYGSIQPLTERFWNTFINTTDFIWMGVWWDNGTFTQFERIDHGAEWLMYSRDGTVSTVYPVFWMEDTTMVISFPTTTRLYYVYPDYTGVFGDETFYWDFYSMPY